MGRYYWSNRRVLEDVYRITIKDLKVWGTLKLGYTTTGTFNLKSIGDLLITINIYPEGESSIEFDYLLKGEAVRYHHDIKLIPCNYGNYRYYFLCRDTGKRVTSLYFVNGYFSSRHYHKLVYQCSRDHRSFFELQNKGFKIRDKAQWLKKVGHPTRAKRMFKKADEIKSLSLKVAVETITRMEHKKYKKFEDSIEIKGNKIIITKYDFDTKDSLDLDFPEGIFEDLENYFQTFKGDIK